jgi:hypothetical protein
VNKNIEKFTVKLPPLITKRTLVGMGNFDVSIPSLIPAKFSMLSELIIGLKLDLLTIIVS